MWNATKKKFDVLRTTDFWGVIGFVRSYVEKYPDEDVTIVIEDVTNIKVYRIPGELPYQREARVRSTGKVQTETRLLIEQLESEGYKVIKVVPRGKLIKGTKKRKLDQLQFTQVTGVTQQLNQHERDAGMLVYDR